MSIDDKNLYDPFAIADFDQIGPEPMEQDYKDLYTNPPDYAVGIARVLQRAAFEGRRRYPPNFRPSPLYMLQVRGLMANPRLIEELIVQIKRGTN